MMKYCSNCGKELEEGVSFCSECGAKVETAQEETAAPVAVPVAEAAPAPVETATPVAEEEEKPKKKSKKGLIIGIIAGAAALIAAAVVVILFATGVLGGKAGEEAEAANKNTADIIYCKDNTLMLLKAGADEAEELGTCENFDDIYALSTYYYEKENKLFYIEGYMGREPSLCCYDLESGDSYPEEVVAGVEGYFVNKDETAVFYVTEGGELGKYILADDEKTILERDVKELYSRGGDIYYITTGDELYLLNEDGENEYIMDDFSYFVMFKDKNDFMYTAPYTGGYYDNAVYKFDGERKEKIIDAYYDSSFVATPDNEVYAYYEGGELHAVIDGKKSSVFTNTVANIVISEDKTLIAYTENDEYDEYNSYGTLYMVSVEDGKLGETKLVCRDVYKHSIYFEEGTKLAYRKRNDDFTYSLCYGDTEVEYNGTGGAYVLKGTPDNFIYYYYNYDEYDGEMTLCEYKDGKTTVVAEFVNTLRNFGDGVLYITGCDSDGENGTLYIYDGKKTKELDNGISKEILSANGSGSRMANWN